jgi:hypothetical protein
MENELSKAYSALLEGTYDSVDRIVINGYFRAGQIAGGFRTWWRALYGSDDELDDTHLMRMAGRLRRRLHGYCEKERIPVIECDRQQRKQEVAAAYLPKEANQLGLFVVLIERASAATWHVEKTSDGRIKNLERKYAYVNHYYFHILDAEWGHVTIRMSGHPPFGVQVILNGHEYIERQALNMGYTLAKSGNCFIDIMATSTTRSATVTGCSENIVGSTTSRASEPSLAQLAETVCSTSIVGQLRQVCERWLYSSCLNFALTTAEQAQSGFRYDYSLFQLEFSHNLLFRQGAQLDQCFQAMIDRTRSRLDLERVKTIFGTKRRPFRQRTSRHTKEKPRAEVVVEQPTYDLTVFKIHFGFFTLKMYSKGERVLRSEAIVHNTKALAGQRQLSAFPTWVAHLRQLLQRFLDQLSWLDGCFVSNDTLDSLPAPGQLDGQVTAGIDLNQPRLRAVLQAVLAHATLPTGFTASQIAAKVRQILHLPEQHYRPRHAAYDLRKLRGKGWLLRIPNAQRYRLSQPGLQTISALLLIRDQLLNPVLAGAGQPKRGPKPKHLNPLDLLLAQIHSLVRTLLVELGFAF